MKALEIRVCEDQGDLVYFKGEPHLIDQLSFVRDERHNCQLIVYATMTPVFDSPVSHYGNAIVDNMLEQQFPDNHFCSVCGCLTFEDDEIVVGGTVYCDDQCLMADG